MIWTKVYTKRQNSILIGNANRLFKDEVLIFYVELSVWYDHSKSRSYYICVRNCRVVDGYPMQDVIMKWKGDGFDLSHAVHGVEGIEIPQFTVKDHRAVSNVENLATGRSAWHHLADLRRSPVRVRRNVLCGRFSIEVDHTQRMLIVKIRSEVRWADARERACVRAAQCWTGNAN